MEIRGSRRMRDAASRKRGRTQGTMQPGARRRERARELATSRTISEVKRTRGGLDGYWSGNVMRSW
jgi:hypothetical protein